MFVSLLFFFSCADCIAHNLRSDIRTCSKRRGQEVKKLRTRSFGRRRLLPGTIHTQVGSYKVHVILPLVFCRLYDFTTKLLVIPRLPPNHPFAFYARSGNDNNYNSTVVSNETTAVIDCCCRITRDVANKISLQTAIDYGARRNALKSPADSERSRRWRGGRAAKSSSDCPSNETRTIRHYSVHCYPLKIIAGTYRRVYLHNNSSTRDHDV